MPNLIFAVAGILFLLTSSPLMCAGIRLFPNDGQLGFSEAPEYRNGVVCGLGNKVAEPVTSCDPSLVHVAMTIDSEYLRGSTAAVHSILRHASCPERIFFHFIAAEFDSQSPRDLTRLVRSVFPSLNFKVYIFREDTVINLISSSIRSALENPLNYARNYLADMLDPCVARVVYLDSDLILVDDIFKLWNVTISGDKVIGAPEYCHANFTNYFTENFWSNPNLTRVAFGNSGSNSNPRSAPCYFNTGVMVMELGRFRKGQYREKIENWMKLQRTKRIYELGSLPPFLLVFGGNVEPIDHRWNQHGLGGDNVAGSCRALHPGPVSLLHWSGKGKPWVRLDEKRPCPLDHLWEPYDLWKGRVKVQNEERREQQVELFGYSINLF